MNTSYLFLNVGKTSQSTEATEFKRYIGIGASFVKAVNPTKKEQDEIMGYESQNEPEYTGQDDNGKFARITFIVATDPEHCNGIDIKNRVTFTLHATPAYNRDQTKVQVLDEYGNSHWADTAVAKAGGKLDAMKFGEHYHIACRGEADLVSFLKAYLGIYDAFDYADGSWVLRKEAKGNKPAASDCLFSFDNVKAFFTGDVSEVKEAIGLQPSNKVKLLYGVHTTDDGKQYQTVATRDRFVLPNWAGKRAYDKLENELLRAKQAGSYATTEFKVQPLAEYNPTPTDLNDPLKEAEADGGNDEMPWD